MDNPIAETADNVATGLILTSLSPQGRALGLRAGDLLTGIDGTAFDGQVATLLEHFRARPEQPKTLWFLRDGRGWPVLCRTAMLGRWRSVPLPDGPGVDPATRGLHNWDVFADGSGRYDTQRQTAPLLALLAPVHLMQMRLWSPLAVWLALTALCLPLGWIAGGALLLLICLYFWQAAPELVRADRAARGFRPWRVVAAPSEAALHRRMALLEPGLRFVHAKDMAPAAGTVTTG